jgi:hypothetical protein
LASTPLRGGEPVRLVVVMFIIMLCTMVWTSVMLFVRRSQELVSAGEVCVAAAILFGIFHRLRARGEAPAIAFKRLSLIFVPVCVCWLCVGVVLLMLAACLRVRTDVVDRGLTIAEILIFIGISVHTVWTARKVLVTLERGRGVDPV